MTCESRSPDTPQAAVLGGPAVRSASRGENGFTLIEVMAVLLIIAFGLAVALPAIQRTLVQSAAGRETQAVRSLFDNARSEAMRFHDTVNLQVSGNDVQVVDSGGTVLRNHVVGDKFRMQDPPGSETPTSTFTFTADGGLVGNGGAMYITDRRDNYFRLWVTPFMGSPRIEMWNGTIWSPRREHWVWK